MADALSGNEDVVVEASASLVDVTSGSTVNVLIAVVVVFGVALLLVVCFCVVAFRVPG